MIIDAPRQDQLAGLTALWQEAFGDPEAYLQLFFTAAFSPERCRCVTKDGKIAAMLYWFDCALEDKSYAYLFAVATAKAYRGQGLCRALMADTHRHLAQLGYAGTILVPAEKSLFDFYGAMGYRNFGGVTRFTCAPGEAAAALQPGDAEGYFDLRQKLLPPGGVTQDMVTLRFLEKQTALYCGDGLLLSCYREEDVLLVQEYLGDPACAPGIVAALGCREGRFLTPGSDPFAMWLPFGDNTPTPTYFGISLA